MPALGGWGFLQKPECAQGQVSCLKVWNAPKSLNSVRCPWGQVGAQFCPSCLSPASIKHRRQESSLGVRSCPNAWGRHGVVWGFHAQHGGRSGIQVLSVGVPVLSLLGSPVVVWHWGRWSQSWACLPGFLEQWGLPAHACHAHGEAQRTRKSQVLFNKLR